MEKTLIISNRLQTSSKNHIDIYPWHHDRPSAENYNYVILDLFFERPAEDGYVHLNQSNQNFFEIGNEIAKCLSAGGIVLALMGPLAVNEKRLADSEDQRQTVKLKYQSDTYSGKYIRDFETSYDWLDQGFLQETRIDALYKKISNGISVLAQWEEAKAYFNKVHTFWSAIQGIDIYRSETEGTLTYRIDEHQRWGCISTGCQKSAYVLARSKHAKEPIAIATNYLHHPGFLVLAPPFNIDSIGTSSFEKDSLETAELLRSFAKSIKEQLGHAEKPITPNWALNHRAPKAVKISSEISELNSKLDNLHTALKPYDEMLLLLFSQSDLLTRQVEKLFNNPDQGLTVKPTPPGDSLDLFVADKEGRTLAIEVTGTKGKLKKGDAHWADFLSYLPEHNEKNEAKRVERIVLVVNTQYETPIEERTTKDDITTPALRLAEDNHICIIRSCDLYQLWLKVLDGMPLQNVFDTLFNQEGLYNPS